MMVGEVVAGLVFGSHGAARHGLHMASHTVALGITAYAYAYARRRRTSGSASGREVNALSTGAVLLAVFAGFTMAYESVVRFFEPVASTSTGRSSSRSSASSR